MQSAIWPLSGQLSSMIKANAKQMQSAIWPLSGQLSSTIKANAKQTAQDHQTWQLTNTLAILVRHVCSRQTWSQGEIKN